MYCWKCCSCNCFIKASCWNGDGVCSKTKQTVPVPNSLVIRNYRYTDIQMVVYLSINPQWLCSKGHCKLLLFSQHGKCVLILIDNSIDASRCERGLAAGEPLTQFDVNLTMCDVTSPTTRGNAVTKTRSKITLEITLFYAKAISG